MKERLVPLLRSPRDGSVLSLRVFEEKAGEVVEGALLEPSGHWYPIEAGVPRLLVGSFRPDTTAFASRHGLEPVDGGGEVRDEDHAATRGTFSDKWSRFDRYGFADAELEFLLGWYQKKFGVASRAELDGFYARHRNVLEVGPGSGFHVHYMARHVQGDVVALDLSAAADTTYRNAGTLPNVHVIQADLMRLPFGAAGFDLVVADGVLHHTPDTRLGVESLWRALLPGGEFFFYVYKQMGALRRFADAYLRERFSALPAEDCYRVCQGITELGRELSRLRATVTLETPIDALGIPAGTHDVQRLIYYNVLKCFWNDAFDYETNNMVNFDWYHPKYAWQHTEEEVAEWLEALGCRDFAFHPANPNGISVLARRA